MDIVIRSIAVVLPLLILIGLCVGTVLNTIIWRLPTRIYNEWYRQCKLFMQEYKLPSNVETQTSWLKPLCQNCSKRVSLLQYIPIYNYFFSKCPACGKRPYFYSLVIEILCAVFAAFFLIYFGITAKAFGMIFFSWLLVGLFAVDFKDKLLPDGMVYTLLWLGLIFSIFRINIPSAQAIAGVVVVYFIMRAIADLFNAWNEKEGMGYGDIKLSAAIAAWIGAKMTFFVVLLAGVTNIFVWIIRAILYGRKQAETPVPFGPYLAIMAWIMLFMMMR